jgi:hypothetical protein
MSDRYTKIVLTVIACALVYICVVITPLPAVSAQQATARPGEFSGPTQVVVVGWRGDAAVPITASQPLQVITERSSGRPDRMIITGWEENASPGNIGGLHPINAKNGVPVVMAR